MLTRMLGLGREEGGATQHCLGREDPKPEASRGEEDPATQNTHHHKGKSNGRCTK